VAFHDFNEIKASNPIGEVAERLGIQMTKSNNTLRAKCPVCESSGDRNMAITPDKGVFYCWTLGKGGDVIALVAHVKGLTVKEAAEYLAGPSAGSTSKEKTTKAEAPSEGGFKALDYLQHDHEAVVALGFEPSDADRIGIGFAPRGVFLKGTVAIPVRLASGKLVGYIGITEAKLPTAWKW